MFCIHDSSEYDALYKTSSELFDKYIEMLDFNKYKKEKERIAKDSSDKSDDECVKDGINDVETGVECKK